MNIIKKLFKKKEKENLIFTIDIITKKKYNHKWQKEKIGDYIYRFSSDYFDGCLVAYFDDGTDFFKGFEIILEGSKFKLNKIKDNKDPDQFFYRYAKFLPLFLKVLDRIMKETKLDFKVVKIQHFADSIADYSLLYIKDRIGKKDERRKK
tara:strand:- start:1655 stop:2104 length:450 start_codon:yes stop_codon:yes gene_type:complete